MRKAGHPQRRRIRPRSNRQTGTLASIVPGLGCLVLFLAGIGVALIPFWQDLGAPNGATLLGAGLILTAWILWVTHETRSRRRGN